MAMLYLEVISGVNAAQRYDLHDGETIIGRQPDCQIVLPHTTVSRRHARLNCQNGMVILQDLGSQNGTIRFNQPIAGTVTLVPGDEFQIDMYVLRLRQQASSDTAAEPVPAPQRVIVPGRNRDDFAIAPAFPDFLAEIDVDTSSDVRLRLHADQKLQATLELINHAGTSLELADVLDRLISGLLRIFPVCERGAVFLRDATGGLAPKIIRHRDQGTNAAAGSEFSSTVHEHVLREAKVVLSRDLQEDSRFDEAASVADAPMRSMMCAPLIGPSKTPLGVVQLDTCSSQGAFTTQDAEILASLATLTGLMVEAARWHAAQVEMARRARDLQVAHAVQLQFLPQSRPTLPGYDFFDFYRSAEAIGGDYYDVFEVIPGVWAFPVGDVAGKGIAAALFMARLSADVRACLNDASSAAEALTCLNVHVCERIMPGSFVTFSLALIDTANHTLTIANAGHIPPFVHQAATGSVTMLSEVHAASGPPLGSLPDWQYREVTFRIEPGDAVMLVTDGVTEAQNPQRDLLGMNSVVKCGRGTRSVTEWGERLTDSLQQHLAGSTRRDDVCIVGIGRHRDD